MHSFTLSLSQKDYVCFEFVPRHHNIIRFRKGLEMIREDFSTVCSYIQFKSGREWNYDLMLGEGLLHSFFYLLSNFPIFQICMYVFIVSLLGRSGFFLCVFVCIYLLICVFVSFCFSLNSFHIYYIYFNIDS